MLASFEGSYRVGLVELIGCEVEDNVDIIAGEDILGVCGGEWDVELGSAVVDVLRKSAFTIWYVQVLPYRTFLEMSQTAVVTYKWLSIARAGRWMTCATSPAPMIPTRSLFSAIANERIMLEQFKMYFVSLVETVLPLHAIVDPCYVVPAHKSAHISELVFPLPTGTERYRVYLRHRTSTIYRLDAESLELSREHIWHYPQAWIPSKSPIPLRVSSALFGVQTYDDLLQLHSFGSSDF